MNNYVLRAAICISIALSGIAQAQTPTVWIDSPQSGTTVIADPNNTSVPFANVVRVTGWAVDTTTVGIDPNSVHVTATPSANPAAAFGYGAGYGINLYNASPALYGSTAYRPDVCSSNWVGCPYVGFESDQYITAFTTPGMYSFVATANDTHSPPNTGTSQNNVSSVWLEEPVGPGISMYSSTSVNGGVTGTFTFEAASTNNRATLHPNDVGEIWALFNTGSSVNGVGACYLWADTNSRTILLANDAGNGWLAPATIGASGAFTSNGQCVINAATATLTPGTHADPTTGVTLTVTVTFQGNFYGHTLNGWALAWQDNWVASSGWLSIGSWAVPNYSPPPPPATVSQSVSINGGAASSSVNSLQTTQFAFTLTDTNGANDVASAQFALVDGSGTRHCAGTWARPATLTLSDGNRGATNGYGLQQADSFCIVSLASITNSPTNSNAVTVVLNFQFDAGFAGTYSVETQVNYNSSNVPLSTWVWLGYMALQDAPSAYYEAISIGRPSPQPCATSSNPYPLYNDGTPITITFTPCGSTYINMNIFTGCVAFDTHVTATISNQSARSMDVTLVATPGAPTGQVTIACGFSVITLLQFLAQVVTPPPTISILQNGTLNITGRTSANPVPVIVGQQIQLVSQLSANSAAISSISWSVQGTNVGNYAPDLNAGASPSALTNGGTSVTFYWVDPGSKNVTVTATLADGTTPSATTTFNVVAPAGTMSATAANQDSITIDTYFGYLGIHYGVNRAGLSAVHFVNGYATPAGYNGQFEWIQTGTTVQSRTHAPSGTVDTSGPCGGVDDGGGTFVYDTRATTDDTPDNQLLTGYSDRQRADSFTMTLMFQPILQNAIFVPVASVNWSWSYEATSQDQGNTWAIAQATPAGTLSPVATTTFPTWGNATPNGRLSACGF